MKIIKHKFRDYCPEVSTHSLILGTFNPDVIGNDANFFYSRGRNYLWKLLPVAYKEIDLRKATKQDKMNFSLKYNIAFIDLIMEVKVDKEQTTNYKDAYLDKCEIKWNDVIGVINKMKNLKKVGFTRISFADIPNINKKVIEIDKYCEENNIKFQRLITPARFYNEDKQKKWNDFLISK